MWRNARVLTTPPSKQNRVPLKTSDKKSPYDPRAPITNSFCKSSSCIFVCLIATAARGENGSEERANPGEMWQSHEHFSWRGGNEIERSYCWTPSSIETLDQNGRLQGSAAFSLYSSWSPANWSYLAGRSNFCLLPRVLRRVHRLLWCPFPVKFGTCRRGTSWGLEPPQRRRGHSSCGCREGVKFLDIEAGRDRCRCGQEEPECSFYLPAGAGQVWSRLIPPYLLTLTDCRSD